MTTMKSIDDKEVRIEGQVIRIARVAEGYDSVEDPERFVRALRECGSRVDIFTFIQNLSETSPKHAFAMEYDNFAAMHVGTFDHWFNNQIDGKTRNMLRKAERAGVSVREVPFDAAFVAGIAKINNESPIRQGRQFPHYGDSLETVSKKNGTFLDRSIFIGAFFEDVLIGYAKLVTDATRSQAGLMQILSMLSHRDKAPNNVLIAQAVRSCAERQIPHLWYAKFSYGKKQRDTLSDFKAKSGFKRVDLPRYYVPLTPLGRFALQFGVHRELDAYIPWALRKRALRVRNFWNSRKLESAKERA